MMNINIYAAHTIWAGTGKMWFELFTADFEIKWSGASRSENKYMEIE